MLNERGKLINLNKGLHVLSVFSSDVIPQVVCVFNVSRQEQEEHYVCEEAPGEKTGSSTFMHLGVFGEGTNVNLLKLNQYREYFLPSCAHFELLSVYSKVQLSEVNTGAIWTDRMNLSHFPDSLLPLQPPHLLSNLTGVWECTGTCFYFCFPAANRPSTDKYRLEVIGKIIYN